MRIKLFLLALLLSLSSIASSHKFPTKAQRIIGAMTCEAVYHSLGTPVGYDMFGCKMPRTCQMLSIKQFFEKNRKSIEFEILDVFYNNFNNQFVIYYGNKGKQG